MSDDRRQKMLAKLKKCLALSDSPEPHEAAAALRQAQKIMAELGITEDDLDGLEIDEALVKTREGFGRCHTMTRLSNMLEDIFGVEAVFERNPGSAVRLNVRYIGPRDRVVLAEYSHRVVWRAMQSSWEKYLETRPWAKAESGKRKAFHLGWLAEVWSKVEALKPSESELNAIKRYVDRKYGKSLKEQEIKGGQNLDGSAYYSGKAAAGDFQLHRPVNEQRLGIEHKKE